MYVEAYKFITDLKPENIMVGFEDSSVMKDYVRAQGGNPMSRKVSDGRSI